MTRDDRIPAFLLEPSSSPRVAGAGGRARATFVDKALGRIAAVARDGIVQWETSAGPGLLQGIDGRVKLPFLLLFLVVASVKREPVPHIALAGFVFLLALASRIGLVSFYRKVFLIAFLFGFLVPFPAALNLVSGGETLIPLARFSGERVFWIYRVPAEVGFTREGLERLLVLFLRVANSVSLSFLVMQATPSAEFLRALKAFKVPGALLLAIHLAYKNIFLFVRTVCDIHLARKSRSVLPPDARRGLEWVAERAAFLFRKTMRRSDDLFLAMRSRGLDESVALRPPGRLAARDLAAGLALLGAGILLLAW